MSLVSFDIFSPSTWERREILALSESDALDIAINTYDILDACIL